MKHLLITLILLTSFFGFSQSDTLDTRRNFGPIKNIFSAIHSAEDALYYADSLEVEYKKSPFYVISYFNTDEGERIDGKIIINDCKIFHMRLTAQEANKNYGKLVEIAIMTKKIMKKSIHYK
jgi:hypothetical protein